MAGGREEVPGGDGGDVGSFGPGVEGTKEVPGGDGGDVGTSGRRVEATKEVPAVAFGLKPVCGDWIAWDWLSASVTVGSEAGGRSAAAASASCGSAASCGAGWHSACQPQQRQLVLQGWRRHQLRHLHFQWNVPDFSPFYADAGLKPVKK